MEDRLSKYLSTIEEDDEKLQNPGMDPFCNARHAIIIIRGEKEICEFYIQLAEVAGPLLRMDAGARKLRVMAEFSDDEDDDLCRYIQSVHRALLAKGL